MDVKKRIYLLANFGGPRDLNEIPAFLTALLTDKEVIRTRFPQFLHTLLFSRIARKRSLKVLPEYEEMGGRSPIFADTETLAEHLRSLLASEIVTFHRYIPATHQTFIKQISSFTGEEIRVIPLFPQFSYATTGSVAKWFEHNLPYQIVQRMRWVKSYPAHPAFVEAHQQAIRNFLSLHNLADEDVILLFSAHGVPQQFIDTGDIYETECRSSFTAIMHKFPKILGRLSYQSKFGRGEWIKPYTIDVCQQINQWRQGRSTVVFVPISFTSDHIETLCEIEKEYMTVIRDNQLNAYRIPALNLNEQWIQAIANIAHDPNVSSNHMLLR